MNNKKEKKPIKDLDITFERYENGNFVKCKISDLINKKSIVTDNIIDDIINHSYIDKTGKYRELIFKFITTCRGFDNFTDEHIKMMSGVLQFNLVMEKLIELKKNIPDICFLIAIANGNSDLVKYMIDKLDIQCTNQHLELACKYGDIKTISCILQQKILPNQVCWKNLIKRKEQKNDSYGYGYRCRYDKIFGIVNIDIKIREMNDVSNLKLLCDYGYIIKQEDFVNMIKYRIYIKDYKKYNLELTDEIHKMCNEVLFFPYKEIKMSIEGYKKILLRVSLSELRKIETYFDIKPNLDCLKILCGDDSLPTSIICHVINKHNIVPDLQCLGLAIEQENLRIIKLIYQKMKDVYKKDDTEKEEKKINMVGNVKIQELGEGLIDFDESDFEFNLEKKLIMKLFTDLNNNTDPKDSEDSEDSEDLEDSEDSDKDIENYIFNCDNSDDSDDSDNSDDSYSE
jgi:hypothetical protein